MGIGYDEAKAAIERGEAKARPLWVLLSAESDRDGYGLKPQPWEGPGEYHHVEFKGEGLGRLVKINTGDKPLISLTPGTGKTPGQGPFAPCPADPETWRKTLAVESVVYHRDGGRGVITAGPGVGRTWLVQWDAGEGETLTVEQLAALAVWWNADELWPSADPAPTKHKADRMARALAEEANRLAGEHRQGDAAMVRQALDQLRGHPASLARLFDAIVGA